MRDTLTNLTSRLPKWKGPLAKDERILRPAGQAVMAGFERGLQDAIPSVRATLGDVTSAMASWTAGPADGTVVIDATGLDRALAEWLRRAVRTKGGGSVQAFAGVMR